MPLVTGQITRDGAVIDVLVGVSRARQLCLTRVGFPIPAAIPIRAVIDTGSYVTGLTPRAFTALGLQPFDVTLVNTPSTRASQPHPCELFDVGLTLVSGTSTLSLPSVHVIAADCWHPNEDIEALIGRDVLAHCVFQYEGPHGTFSLAF